MRALKSELKQLVTHEIGVRVDDQLEAAKREQAVLEGRQAAFLEGAKTAEMLLGYVDKDIDEEKMDLPTAEHVKRFLVRTSHALNNLAAQASNFRIAQTGKVQGLEQTVTLLKGMIDAEKVKAEALVTAAAAPPAATPRERPVGAAPVSIKAQRLAEEAPTPKKKGGRKPRATNA
jgi:hypothetical protein